MALEEALIFHPRRFPEGDWQLADVPHEDALFRADGVLADARAARGWLRGPAWQKPTSSASAVRSGRMMSALKSV
jgi:hypothetical protein